MSDQYDRNTVFAQVIAHSWGDPDYRAKLLADPTGTLADDAGFQVPEGKRVVIVEDTDDVIHLVLPARPTELSDEDLDTVSGGMCTTMCCGTKEGGFSL
ncbi:hypothetical protein GCM10028798_27140 [Humibacter antri]